MTSSPPTPPRLFLIDGHAQVYKAFHAIQSLSNARGEPTNAIYGFLQTFHRIRREYQPNHIAVVFDPPGPSFRNDLLPTYKANRPPQPPELSSQIGLLKELLAVMAVPVFEVAGFEADDVLAAMALWAANEGGEALVVSVDKDLLQVVRPGVRILREHLGRIEVMDEAAVVEKLGVRPDQVPAYLGLLGDSSDNIPGVPGIGKKRASELLAEYGTLEALLEAAEGRTKPKFWASLAENKALALNSRLVATVRTDIPLPLAWDSLRWEYADTPALREYLSRLEFRSLLEELGGQTLEERTTGYATVRTRADLERAAAQMRVSGLVAIDTETTGLDPFGDELVGISLAWRPDQAVYIPVRGAGRQDCLDLAAIRELLDPLLRDPAIRWVAHNWRFDCKMLQRAGFTVDAIAFDTLVASYLLNPDRSSNALKTLGLEVLGIQMTRYDEVVGGVPDMVTLASVDVAEVSDYACQDADVTRQLACRFDPMLEEAGLRPLFDGIEMPLVPVLARMELEGIRLDRRHFAALSAEFAGRLDALRAEIHGIAGRPFNINSPKQVGEVLFDELNLPTGKKTSSGYSTDVTVLEALARETDHPMPVKLLEFRQLEKLRGTYIDALPSMVNPHTGRIHTSFNQTIAATGRLSSSDPNLQNIPVRTEEGRKIRQGFVARAEGWRLLSADYSQIELRILAHLSADAALVSAFNEGHDIHALTASKVYRVPLDQVSKEMRNSAKAINFGIIYGMTAFRLARDLRIPRETADRFIQDYFEAYQGVRDWLEQTREECRRTGSVRTLMGRRRPVPDINSPNVNARQAAERVACNTPIQGTSADMIKMAMIRIDRRLRTEGLRARMILQVHDELIFDVPDEEVGRLLELVPEEMKAALPLSVPVQVDVGTGDNWAEL